MIGRLALRSWLVAAGAALIATFSVESSAQVVISQVYGGGGNSGATYTHDFVELFNQGGAAVDITGWSVQYASSSGTSWQVTDLSGSIQPGGYYLIQQAQGAGGTTALPTPDAVGTIPMAASNGKIALASDNTPLDGADPTAEASVVDFVGYGSANAFLGSGATPGLTNTTAAIRKGDGCIDTQDNAEDFIVAAPEPRNSASPTNDCQSLTSELLNAFASDTDKVRVIFDIDPSPLAVGDFTLTDSQAAASISSIDTISATAYDLVLSADLTDTLTDSVQYVPTGTSFDFIGGITDLANYRNGTIGVDEVITVDVTITASQDGLSNRNNVAAQQDGPPEGAGVLFFDSGFAAATTAGETLRVAATTFIFTDSGGSARKQLASPIIVDTLAPVAITPTVLPVADFLFNNAADSNPAEQYEGVLIRVEDVEFIEALDFGEAKFTAGSGQDVHSAATFYNPFTGNPTSVIALDETADLGKTYAVIGIGWESFGAYKIQPRNENDIEGEPVLSAESWELYQ